MKKQLAFTLLYVSTNTVIGNLAFATETTPEKTENSTSLTQKLEGLAQTVQLQQQQIDALQSKNDTLSNISIGGYGEAVYTDFDNSNKQYDAYRFVTYLGYQFSPQLRLHSELEIEHGLIADTDTKTCTIKDTTATCSTSTKPGEVELEQMYLHYQVSPNFALSMGQILVPIGFINLYHEPDTFYGVNRNPIETNIIPTTWWEGGIQAQGNIAKVEGLSYVAMVSTGLKTNNGSIRSGRQKGAKANAEALAYTAGLTYTRAGLLLGATAHQQTDMSQKSNANANSATLFETHASYQYKGLVLRGLYAQWVIDNLSLADKSKAKQDGYYLESNYRFAQTKSNIANHLGVFARYSVWDNENSANASGTNTDSSIKQINYGLNYYLAPQAVIKLDIQHQTLADNSKRANGFALGIGYSF